MSDLVFWLFFAAIILVGVLTAKLLTFGAQKVDKWLASCDVAMATILSSSAKIESPSRAREVTPSRLEERALVISKAAQMSLLDGIFSVILFNQWRRTSGPPPYANAVELSEVFPTVADEELEIGRIRVQNLLAASYEAGDCLLTKKFKNYAEVTNKLTQKFPGFSEESYDEAISFGCFQAR